MKKRIKVWGLRLRIWLIEKLGGESEDLSYRLWILTRPPAPDVPLSGFDKMLADFYLKGLHNQINNRSIVLAEWQEDVEMPRITQ